MCEWRSVFIYKRNEETVGKCDINRHRDRIDRMTRYVRNHVYKTKNLRRRDQKEEDVILSEGFFETV